MKENGPDHLAETYLEDIELQVFRSPVHAVSPGEALLRKGRPDRTLAEENSQGQSQVPANGVNGAHALSIAEADAVKSYRDLSHFRVVGTWITN